MYTPVNGTAVPDFMVLKYSFVLLLLLLYYYYIIIAEVTVKSSTMIVH